MFCIRVFYLKMHKSVWRPGCDRTSWESLQRTDLLAELRGHVVRGLVGKWRIERKGEGGIDVEVCTPPLRTPAYATSHLGARIRLRSIFCDWEPSHAALDRGTIYRLHLWTYLSPLHIFLFFVYCLLPLLRWITISIEAERTHISG